MIVSLSVKISVIPNMVYIVKRSTATTSPNEKSLEIFRGRNGQDGLSGLRGKMDLLDQKETQQFLVLKEVRQVE